MKRGTPDHPKVALLAEKIDQPIYAAVGILEMLWHFTAEFAPRGNIGKFPDKSICAGIKWGKSRINVIQVLVDCGFLEPHPEHRLIVHDWQDHADQAVKRKLERSGDEFVTSHRLDDDESASGFARGSGSGKARRVVQGEESAREEGDSEPHAPESAAPDNSAAPPDPNEPQSEEIRRTWFVEEFWGSAKAPGAVWARIGGKDAALAEWLKRVKTRADCDAVLAAAREQGPEIMANAIVRAGHEGGSPRPLHPRTWLHQGRHEDEIAPLLDLVPNGQSAVNGNGRGHSPPLTFAERNEQIRREKFAKGMLRDLANGNV